MRANRVVAPVHQRHGVPECIITTQTMRKDNKGPLKHPKVSEIWRPHTAQPTVYGRHLERIEGARHLRRPSAVANAEGKRRITELAEYWPDEYGDPIVSEDDEPMPDEFDQGDTGWRAGPASRERLPFNGPTPGLTNPDLHWGSSYTAIMDELITPEFKAKWVERTLEHVAAWRADHPGWRTNWTERAAKKPKKVLTANGFDLWMACKIRAAQLKPEVPCALMWNRQSNLYDVEVHRAMPYTVFQWMNRHAAFAKKYEPTVDNEEEEEEEEEEEGDGRARVRARARWRS
jgi:hypothetical protein